MAAGSDQKGNEPHVARGLLSLEVQGSTGGARQVACPNRVLWDELCLWLVGPEGEVEGIMLFLSSSRSRRRVLLLHRL